MPSHSGPCGFVKAFKEDGAPWFWVKWQDITGVYYGLFPDDDALLPNDWTRQKADDIRSFFTRYLQASSEEDRLQIANGRKTFIPGVQYWNDYVNGHFTKTWGVSVIIIRILNNHKVHPLRIMLSRKPQNLDKWPSGDMYIPLVVDDVGHALYGDEAFNEDGLLPTEIRAVTQIFIQRTWSNLRGQITRSRNRLAKMEQKVTSAFKALDREKPTKARITTVIRTVATWKSLAEVFGSTENLQLMEDMENELTRLMIGLGANVKSGTVLTAPKLCKVTAAMLATLATDDGIREAILLYQDYFKSSESQPEMIEPEPSHSLKFAEMTKGASIGVDFEATLSPESLASNLGFKEGLPVCFNALRHRGGLTPWDPQYRELLASDPAHVQFDPIVLHPHQLAGVHAVIRKNFTLEPSPSQCTGMLIADEVGLGKTFLTATLIAFLMTILRGQGKYPLPPILSNASYLAEHQCLPQLPYLIVVPGTILSQWEVELKTLFLPQSVDIFIYTGGKSRAAFWAADGPFHSSKLELGYRIIIATHTAVQADFNLLYHTPRAVSVGGSVPWDLPDKLPSYNRHVSETLFCLKYLLVAFDEIQHFRNCGPKHAAALLIMALAILRLALTATPLHTSPKDVAAIGRIIGINYFLSRAAWAEEKEDLKALRNAKPKPNKPPPQPLSDDGRPPDQPVELDNHNEPQIDTLRVCQVKIATRMNLQFDGRVIRRSLDSLDWQEKPLLNLPPCIIIHGCLDLTKREIDIIEDIAAEIKPDASTGNSGTKTISAHSFYLIYRMGTAYALEPDAQYIPFTSLDAWSNAKSTKMDVAAKIIAYLLTRDDAPDVTFSNGAAIFSPFPQLADGHAITQENKVVLYLEFPSLGHIMRNVLDLYSIGYMCIDGQTTFDQRSRAVERFNNDPTIRLAVISPACSVGLNLSRANALILLDQPWSAQDERQIRGRVHRQPQKKPVTVYHLLANETADIILSGMARGKHDMLEAFLSNGTGNMQDRKDMLDTIRGKMLEKDDADFEDNEPKTKTELRAIEREQKKAMKDEAMALKAKEAALKAVATNEKAEAEKLVKEERAAAEKLAREERAVAEKLAREERAAAAKIAKDEKAIKKKEKDEAKALRDAVTALKAVAAKEKAAVAKITRDAREATKLANEEKAAEQRLKKKADDAAKVLRPTKRKSKSKNVVKSKPNVESSDGGELGGGDSIGTGADRLGELGGASSDGDGLVGGGGTSSDGDGLVGGGGTSSDGDGLVGGGGTSSDGGGLDVGGLTASSRVPSSVPPSSAAPSDYDTQDDELDSSRPQSSMSIADYSDQNRPDSPMVDVEQEIVENPVPHHGRRQFLIPKTPESPRKRARPESTSPLQRMGKGKETSRLGTELDPFEDPTFGLPVSPLHYKSSPLKPPAAPRQPHRTATVSPSTMLKPLPAVLPITPILKAIPSGLAPPKKQRKIDFSNHGATIITAPSTSTFSQILQSSISTTQHVPSTHSTSSSAPNAVFLSAKVAAAESASSSVIQSKTKAAADDTPSTTIASHAKAVPNMKSAVLSAPAIPLKAKAGTSVRSAAVLAKVVAKRAAATASSTGAQLQMTDTPTASSSRLQPSHLPSSDSAPAFNGYEPPLSSAHHKDSNRKMNNSEEVSVPRPLPMGAAIPNPHKSGSGKKKTTNQVGRR